MNIVVLQHADGGGSGLWEEFCRQGGIAVEVVDLHRGRTRLSPASSRSRPGRENNHGRA